MPASKDICFTQESWCGVTAQTALPGADAAEYLRNAVRFCNETLWGTLNAGIIVHPKTVESLGGVARAGHCGPALRQRHA
jgi:hypothetical protein